MTDYGDFFDELVRLEIDLWGRLDELLASKSAVSVAQLQGLRAIAAHNGEARVQDVSADMRITVGAASKLVDRLERAGLAERSAHPTDRRSMLIALTETGRLAYTHASAAAQAGLQSLLAPIVTSDQAAEVTQMLAALSEHLVQPQHDAKDPS